RRAVERDRADPRRPLEGAVGRIEVGHLQAFGAQLQLEVIARHALVGELQIVVLMRSEQERAVVDLGRGAGVRTGDDRDAIAARLERARRVVGKEQARLRRIFLGHSRLRRKMLAAPRNSTSAAIKPELGVTAPGAAAQPEWAPPPPAMSA